MVETPKKLIQLRKNCAILLSLPLRERGLKSLVDLCQLFRCRPPCQEELDEMFTELIMHMYKNPDHFGEILMVNGKAIQSFGTKTSRNGKSGCRGEHDAYWHRFQK